MTILTVGIPVYNGMPYLPETVESILRQSHSDFEFIIIDDGSTDGTHAYLETLSDPRLRIIRQNNRGLSATLNRMLEESQGTWHVRQDADDIALPDRLRFIVEAITRSPESGMFYSPAHYLFRGAHRGHYRSTLASPATLRALTKSGRLIAINHSSAVLNVERTRALGGYRTDLLSAQDQDLWWRMALHHDIQLIAEPTIAYRLASSGLSSSSLARQSIEVLYAQYLLLSHLWSLPVRTLEEMSPILEKMLDMKLLEYRANLRRAGLAYDQRRYGQFLVNAAHAVLTAPKYLTQRLAYERGGSDKLVVNGVDPMMFAANKKALWPGSER